MNKNKILWVDDEIDLLRSHILFLTEKGYEVDSAVSGEDAIAIVKEKKYDLIFLDEMMVGKGGLETLSEIKEIHANLPVVMITKNEAESLMNEAIGAKIADYLIKPVNPSQVLLVCKKILEGKKISGDYVAKDYLQGFNEISRILSEDLDYCDWTDLYLKLTNWDLELDAHPEIDLRQSLFEQRRDCNREFCKYIEKKYSGWLLDKDKKKSPKLTPEITGDYLFNHLKDEENCVFFFVIDCLRLDQWLVMERHLIDYFNIEKDYYYGILPTATPYARNSLFAGLYPSEIEMYFPDLWTSNDENERSMNKYEKEMLQMSLDRKRIKLKNDLKYIKIIDPEVGKSFEQNIKSYQNSHLTAVVVNILDMIAHGRSDSELLKQIAPDEAAFRSLTNSWFAHSSLLSTFKAISRLKNAIVVVTTDHGSIRAMRGAKTLGDRETSTNLRFKFGRNIKADEKHAIFIKNPLEYKLPKRGVIVNYLIAKEDYYFVYPTEYHKFLSYYKDTFQHGGVSMEEMILPVITMRSKI